MLSSDPEDYESCARNLMAGFAGMGGPEANEAVAILRGRGLSTDTLQRFKIGVTRLLHKKEEGSGGFRITIPVFDGQGRSMFCRRYHPAGKPKIWGRTAGGEAGALYGEESLAGLRGTARFVGYVPRIHVCEGEFDRLMLEQHGFPAVTGTGGPATWQDAWTPLFDGVDVVVCYDGDRVGEIGGRKVVEALVKRGLAASVRMVHLGMDAQKHDVSTWFNALTDEADVAMKFRRLVDEQAERFEMKAVP